MFSAVNLDFALKEFRKVSKTYTKRRVIVSMLFGIIGLFEKVPVDSGTCKITMHTGHSALETFKSNFERQSKIPFAYANMGPPDYKN